MSIGVHNNIYINMYNMLVKYYKFITFHSPSFTLAEVLWTILGI